MEPIAELEQTVEEGVKAVSAFQSFLDRYGWSIVGGVVILVVGIMLAALVRRMIKKILSHQRFNTSAAGMISQTVYIVIIALTLSTVLGKLGVPMTSFVAVMGAVGVGVGLALKDTLSNVAAGLIILFFRPFRVGDTIEEEGKRAGVVSEIQIMHTILTRMDGCKVIIPNAEISKNRVINYTESPERRVDLKIQISYNNDYQEAISLLKE
ncbi:MAG: mechanosensitive ion channel family protein, partial [Filifactor alocis]|nr:mechanosensitive ion channel family protein [Filifactor alocis]